MVTKRRSPSRNQCIVFRKVIDMSISVTRSARRWLAYTVAIAATAVALPLCTLSANAADMLVPPPPQAMATPLWSGFYIGAHGGGGWGSSRIEDPNFQIAFIPVKVKSD